MKRTNEILSCIKVLEVVNSLPEFIAGICFDSREVESDFLFVAIKGSNSDGHTFISSVIIKGASCVVCEDLPEILNPKICYIRVNDSSEALGLIAASYFDHPSTKIKVVGVTGTNGKTTIATLLYNLFTAAGYKCGLLSTIRNIIGETIIPSTHTTPDALRIQQMFQQMQKSGCTYCFMEVSSHSVVQNRISGIVFAGGIFTNLTHDHLDYHKTFESYLKAKKGFFDSLGANAFALTNADDKNGKVMLQNCEAKRLSYGMKTIADIKGRILENAIDGLHMNVEGKEVWFPLVGAFNAYNLLAIYGVSILLGLEKDKVLQLMSSLKPAEGRFEYLKSDEGVVVVVDYAHTPDALQNVLETIQQIGKRDKKIFTVVGAGGNRDRTKRPVMASIAVRLSSLLILTSDNPRDEDPEDILDEMMSGISSSDSHRVLRISARKEAIRAAVLMAKPGDVVLVAGKGHEKYQEIKGVKHPFDDKQIMKEILTKR